MAKIKVSPEVVLLVEKTVLKYFKNLTTKDLKQVIKDLESHEKNILNPNDRVKTVESAYSLKKFLSARATKTLEERLEKEKI